jgi:group II intron reverse transcriptase/maturase
MAFTTLAHHIDMAWLEEAYRRTRKSGAAGVDRCTAEEYAKNLEENLRRLLDRFKSGTYKAPPVRRVHIPKGDGKTRPIGVPTFEDKVLQRAVAMVLEAVYEQDFRDSSYGFRPGRSAHQALDALWHGVMAMGGGWVVEVDIKSFFDTLDHRHLRHFLDQRVRDGVLRRAIDKWLKAGVLEDGVAFTPESGTPQGGVISPLLANIYLHEVLDRWFEDVVRPRLEGNAFLVRFADDVALVFSSERDAHRVLAALPKRFGRYGLKLHPDKTRMVALRRPRKGASGKRGKRPGTFELLGFTHYWGVARSGAWVVKRKTAPSRFRRALGRVRDLCRSHRHWSLAEQQRMLAAQVRGHCGYYGITGNSAALARFCYELRRIWKRWLSRRSQHGRLTWEQFQRILERYPHPPAVALHSVCRHAAKP